MNSDQARFYLAAMIDGEGHVECLLGKNGYWYRRVSVANTDLALIQAVAECCELVGVDYTIRQQKRREERFHPLLVLRIAGIGNLKILLDCVPLRSPKKLRALQLAVATAKKPHLTSRQRKEIVWLTEEGLTAREIAHRIGFDERTVRATLKKAREASLE